MMRCFFALLFALAALVAAAPAQRTYTVGLTGGDFKNLTEALAAVSPSDTLIVWAGSIEDVSTSKGVRIVGEIGVVGPLVGVLTVHDLPEDQTFSLANFMAPYLFSNENLRLALKDNRGKVHVDGIFIWGGTERSFVKIESSAHVSINECQLWDLAISDSTVVITDSAITGYDGSQSRSPSSAIVSSGSELTLANCRVVGGFGAYPAMPPAPPGIDMDGGSLLATGTSQACIQGGWIYPSSTRVEGPAIRSDNGSVVLHPDVRLNCFFGGLPLTTGTSQFTKRRIPFMEVHRVLPGSTRYPLLPARLFADAQSLGGIFVSLPGKPFSFSMGELWLELATSLYVGAGVLPGGTDPMIEIGIRVPATVPVGSTFTFQSLVLLQGGQAILSTPVEVVLGGRQHNP